MYPLNMTKAAIGAEPCGFAVANDENEHQALTDKGYGPAFEGKKAAPAPIAPEGDKPVGYTVETARAKLDELGIAYHPRAGLEKLLALIPE